MKRPGIEDRFNPTEVRESILQGTLLDTLSVFTRKRNFGASMVTFNRCVLRFMLRLTNRGRAEGALKNSVREVLKITTAIQRADIPALWT
jgi:hypothetical protein